MPPKDSQQSGMAGRAAFITSQPHQANRFSEEIGIPEQDTGLRDEDPALAELLKPHGYAIVRFGKNYRGDLDAFFQRNRGFDEFHSNLYHLNAKKKPENLFYP